MDVPNTAPPIERRIWDLERDVGDLKDAYSEGRKLRNAIVLATVAAFLSMVISAGAALVAYGRLTQQAETTERLLTEVRADLQDMRREIRASGARL